MKRELFRNFPNYLTFFRIVTIPLIVWSFFLEEKLSHVVGFTFFVVASITDFIDGYLARKFNFVTKIGKIFDPLADKALVVCTLFMLVSFSRVEIIPCLLIVIREFTVSGLREILGQVQISIKVTYFAKIKTSLQMIAISATVLGTNGSGIESLDSLSNILLWISSIITVITGIQYFISYKKYFSYG
ncbi:MAG: CDP-diacylglycerol--glycerol-3-phosphate 3-phosphatidyltransferase [Rickettsia sp.]|nr:CDP-diacylglycerol--glycerol-3-phosphate 3-phosphatidyltransferase [Rickettsia sp.]